MIDTSNINSVNDITNLKIKDANKPSNYQDGDVYQCFACESWKYIDKMYSQDWCKACYRYWLKCKFQGIKFVAWKDKKDRFPEYQYQNKYGSW